MRRAQHLSALLLLGSFIGCVDPSLYHVKTSEPLPALVSKVFESNARGESHAVLGVEKRMFGEELVGYEVIYASGTNTYQMCIRPDGSLVAHFVVVDDDLPRPTLVSLLEPEDGLKPIAPIEDLPPRLPIEFPKTLGVSPDIRAAFKEGYDVGYHMMLVDFGNGAVVSPPERMWDKPELVDAWHLGVANGKKEGSAVVLKTLEERSKRTRSSELEE